MSTTELIQSAVPLPAQTDDSVSNNCKAAALRKPLRIEPEQDRETFFRALQSFHESRNTPITRLPKINGQEVDLYLLYNEVINRGGWLKVNIRNEWDELVHAVGFQQRCVNAAVAIKTIYTRYLDKYERLHFLGEDPDKADDLDDDGRPKKWSSKTYNSIPMTYNYKQHELNEEQRNANRMSEDLYKESEYDKLLLSLISPLPNEQDFAINVCTLMSNESKHTLKLDHCPKLLDALLAHAGVFCHYTMRELFQDLYTKVRRHSLQSFWKDLLHDKPQILELSFDDYYQTIDEKYSETAVNVPPFRLLEKDNFQDGLNADGDEVDMNDLNSLDFLALGRGLGTQEYIGQRVHQIASIIRNLSFYDENISVLARNRTFVRFLVMGSNIRWGNLHHMVLDVFGNIATELELQDPTLDDLTRCLMSTVCEGIESSDRGVIISCLEVLYKVCQQDDNEEYIHRCLNQRLYNTLCLYLSLNDIMLLLYTLEAIYALSSLGHRACNSLVQVKGVINSLMSLITVEAQSYGPDGCILMRVVETVPGNMLPMVAQNIANIANLQNAIYTQQPTQQQEATASGQGAQIASPARPSQETTPQQGTKSPNPSQQEHEQFALSWLSATFEPTSSSDSRVEQQELYRMYLSATQKCGRRGIVSHTQFPRMVRTIFGANCGPTLIKKTEGTESNKVYYVCIRVRANPLPIQMKVQSPQKGLKEGKIKIDPGSIKKTKKRLKLQEQLKQEHQQKQPLPTLANTVGVGQQKTTTVVSQQQGVVKVEAITQQQGAVVQQQQQPQILQQSVAKIESQSVLTSSKLPLSTQVSKITNTTQPQLIGNVLVTHTPQATLVQQSATPIKVTAIAEQPQVAQHQIQIPCSAQQITQHIMSSTPSTSSNGGNGGTQPSSSLIKSLLANKVTSSSTATAITTTNTSATTNANAPAAVVIDTNASAALNTPQSCLITQNVNLHQVAQRQQKQKELAAQQQQHQNSSIKLSSTSISALVNNPLIQTTPMKVGQTTIKPINNSGSGEKKNTIISSENSDNSNWDPIPPMAPLSSGTLVRSNVILQQQVLSANDDSSSTSIASSVISSSQIEGDGSFASFEGLLMSKSNKTVSTFVIEDDSSKDSLSRGSKDSGRQVLIANQMLVDLLDKKSPDPPLSMKRKHDEESEESDGKKILLEVEPKITASKNAANLYAEMAASILEDEDLEEEQPSTSIQQPKMSVQTQPQLVHQQQQQQQQHQQHQQQQQQQQQELQKQVISMPVNMQRQLIVNPNNPHQMILSQSTPQSNIPTATATIKTDQGLQTVPVILQKNAMGQQILQPVIQQQQQPQQQTQYVLATNPQGQTYLVAQQSQPQQQTQRLLLTQTAQQQVAGTKTIIILQQQGGQTVGQQQMITTSSQPQKVIMTTPQGQQMIVTQMPRPVQHQIYMNTGGGNVIQATPMQSHIQMPSQQQIMQKQIQSQPQNSNILSQLSHIPATIKIHQTSSPMITASMSQPVTTTATTTSLPRLGKSVSIVQQQGIPPPQTQVTPTVMQAQIVQHTGAPGCTEKRQVIISGGRAIEIADSNQQGQQMVRMIQSPQQHHQQKQTVTIQKPTARPTQINVAIQPQPNPASSVAVKIPTPPPQPSVTTSSTATTIATATATPTQSTAKTPMKVKLEVKPEIKIEAKQEIKGEAKAEKVDDDHPPVDVNWLFVCDWRNCPRKKFKSIADLHHHSCLVHCPEHLDVGAEIFCQWGPGPGLCDGIPRKRFSLMTHILDRHLTVESLKAAVQRRLAGGPQAPSTGQPVTIIKNAAAVAAQQQAVESTRGTSSPALSTSSNGSMPSTGSAAMHAIKRHASDFINPKELMNPDFANLLSIETTANTTVASSNTISMHPASITTSTTTPGLDTLSNAMQSNSLSMVPDGDENEGPVTKSIRLTAALILRNLVTYTPAAKRTLRQYEPHLASVALSNVESSGTISQILFELNN